MSLHLINTDKFKSTVMVLLLRQPLERERATETAIIPSLLSRGSRNYPTISKIQSELEDMCGAIFEAQVVKKAEEQLIQLYMEIMPSPNGTKGLNGQQARALKFMSEILSAHRGRGL
jgi:hypothetical protein